MFYSGNYIPIAFLPYKDIFLGKRESNIIMTWYNSKRNVLDKRRKDVKIIPQIIPLYNFISNNLYKPLETPDIIYDIENPIRTNKKIFVKIKKIKYNYLSVFLKIDNNNWMTFKINNEVQSAEEFSFSIENNNIDMFNNLLQAVLKLFSDKLFYIEIWISAYEPELQKSCYSMGFIPVGYFPAIHKNLNNNKREDRIIFVKSKRFPQFEGPENNLILIEPTRILYRLVNDQYKKLYNT